VHRKRTLFPDDGQGAPIAPPSFFYATILPHGGPSMMKMMMKMKLRFLLLLLTLLPVSLPAQPKPETGKPFVVEYYYKAKWGYADEFLQLFKKNHYPLLQKQVEMGRMLKVWMDQPRYHTTEDGRWDYRVTIVFKNSAAANEPFDEDALKKQLWPDQATYAREEQRRFEILVGHWDLPIKIMDLDSK
jgi:hypothetical protein